MRRLLSVLGTTTLLFIMVSCSESRQANPSNTSAVDADNTAKNERDRSGATVTPGDQSGTDADREITANVRKAVVADDSLSTNAQNVKIVTINGEVTLRGPVKSISEKQAIAAKAKLVAGVSSVVDLLEVEGN